MKKLFNIFKSKKIEVKTVNPEVTLATWRFEESIKALIALSKNAVSQREFIGYGDVNFELVDEFESHYKGYQADFVEQKLIDLERIPILDNILHFIEYHSAENKDEFWEDSSIENSWIWAELRIISKNALYELNMSNWDIEIKRTVDKSNGHKDNPIFVERTYVELIRKEC